MSAVLILGTDASWMVAGWVWDHCFRLSFQFLPTNAHPSPLVQAIQASEQSNMRYIDLEKFAKEDVKALLIYLKKGFEEVKNAGPKSDSFAGDEKFYQGFMDSFSDLIGKTENYLKSP